MTMEPLEQQESWFTGSSVVRSAFTLWCPSWWDKGCAYPALDRFITQISQPHHLQPPRLSTLGQRCVLYKLIVSVLAWIKAGWEEWPLQARKGGDTTEAAVLGQASSLQVPRGVLLSHSDWPGRTALKESSSLPQCHLG